MVGPDRYELPDAYLTQRFTDRLVPFVFGRHRPSPAPVLVLVAGQPAAGKSLAMARLTRRYRDQDLVAVTGDALRQVSPPDGRVARQRPPSQRSPTPPRRRPAPGYG